MKSEWKECTIGDIASVKGGKRLPKGVNLITERNSHPYIRIKDLTEKILELKSSYEYVDDDTQKSISRYIVATGDILISIVGTIGLIAVVGDSLKGANLTENCVKLINIKEDVDKDFLYYFLVSSMGQDEIKKGTVGAVQPKLPIKNIQSIRMFLPPIEIQQQISGLLATLDRKIELNNKINENLEQQAQAIFKSWFVDFEPFGGKMPAEWKIGTISDICRYSKDKVNIENLTLDTYYSTENMQPNRQGAVQATALPTIKQTTACQKGDVLVSNIRPYFKKILYCFSECGCSTDVLCFVPNITEFSAYLYCTLYSDKFFDYMVAGAKGTKMPRGDKQQIMMYPICIPSTEYISKFNQAISPMLETVYNNRNEVKELAYLRDTLLPKLMNGEIDVTKIKI